MTQQHFAAITTMDQPIWGIGRTADEAIADAMKFIEGDTTTLVALPCTRELYKHVKNHGGGETTFGRIDGVLVLDNA